MYLIKMANKMTRKNKNTIKLINHKLKTLSK